MRVSCLPFICDASHERLIEPWVKLLASNAGAAETGLSVVAVGLSADDCPRKAWEDADRWRNEQLLQKT
jgi:hypothetical protein